MGYTALLQLVNCLTFFSLALVHHSLQTNAVSPAKVGIHTLNGSEFLRLIDCDYPSLGGKLAR